MSHFLSSNRSSKKLWSTHLFAVFRTSPVCVSHIDSAKITLAKHGEVQVNNRATEVSCLSLQHNKSPTKHNPHTHTDTHKGRTAVNKQTWPLSQPSFCWKFGVQSVAAHVFWAGMTGGMLFGQHVLWSYNTNPNVLWNTIVITSHCQNKEWPQKKVKPEKSGMGWKCSYFITTISKNSPNFLLLLWK